MPIQLSPGFWRFNAVARPARIPLVGISSIQQRCATIADLRVWCCTRPDSNSIHYRTVSGFTRHCHTLGDAGAIQVIVSSRFGVERIGVVIWGGRTATHMAIHAAATPRLSVRMLPSVIGSPGGCLGAICYGHAPFMHIRARDLALMLAPLRQFPSRSQLGAPEPALRASCDRM